MKTRKNKKSVEHYHFLLRLETKLCPSKHDLSKMKTFINTIIHDIKMKKLDEPRVYYVENPKYGEGLTAIVPIQTSHIAFHFWTYPEKQILQNPESKCLLEFDIYTCGLLHSYQLKKIIHHMSVFLPTHMDATLLNRKKSLAIDMQMKWDLSDCSWNEFCKRKIPTRGK